MLNESYHIKIKDMVSTTAGRTYRITKSGFDCEYGHSLTLEDDRGEIITIDVDETSHDLRVKKSMSLKSKVSQLQGLVQMLVIRLNLTDEEYEELESEAGIWWVEFSE